MSTLPPFQACRALNSAARVALAQAIAAQPGACRAELAGHTPLVTMDDRLGLLEATGIIQRLALVGAKRCVLTEYGQRLIEVSVNPKVWAALDTAGAYDVALSVGARPGISTRELCARLGSHPTVINLHIRHQGYAGLVSSIYEYRTRSHELTALGRAVLAALRSAPVQASAGVGGVL